MLKVTASGLINQVYLGKQRNEGRALASRQPVCELKDINKIQNGVMGK